MRIKEDILACTAAELNYGLAQFVKEITRPNGERYEPDSIYYLCLGIQQVREGLLPSSPPQPDLGVRCGEGACTLYGVFWGPREAHWTLLQCLTPGQQSPGSIFVPKPSSWGGSYSLALHPSCTFLRRAARSPKFSPFFSTKSALSCPGVFSTALRSGWC